MVESMTKISTHTIAYFSILDFIYDLGRKILPNSENLEQILVVLSLTVFSGLNAFIYKLALE